MALQDFDTDYIDGPTVEPVPLVQQIHKMDDNQDFGNGSGDSLTIDRAVKPHRVTSEVLHELGLGDIDIPHQADALAAQGGNAFFSTMDLTSGYYNVEVHEDNKKFTAFTSHFGII
jgi:hypothetical protein